MDASDPAEVPEPGERAPMQPRLRRAWYVLCFSEELRDGALLQRTLFGQPIVLFRGPEGPGALLDRCPHRNVPLSRGRVVEGRLACGYHGWQFAPDGACKHIPALVGQAESPARRCRSFPCVEQQGAVWVWAAPDCAPDHEPYAFRCVDAPGYTVVRRVLGAEGSVHAVAENALDVPHTAFAHGGLFRDDTDRSPITCRVTRTARSVECEYIGEARPDGIIGRILSPSGGTVVHHDRFHLPSIAQVEYRIGDENHILVDAALTPVSDHETRLHAVVCLKTRVPIWLIKPFALAAALRIFGQDQEILASQTATLRRFGDARFVSTELDALGPHILRLMRQAERGALEPDDAAPYIREFQMLV